MEKDEGANGVINVLLVHEHGARGINVSECPRMCLAFQNVPRRLTGKAVPGIPEANWRSCRTTPVHILPAASPILAQLLSPLTDK